MDLAKFTFLKNVNLCTYQNFFIFKNFCNFYQLSKNGFFSFFPGQTAYKNFLSQKLTFKKSGPFFGFFAENRGQSAF